MLMAAGMKTLATLLAITIVGCATPPGSTDGSGNCDGKCDGYGTSKTDPLLMPTTIVKYLKANNWGMMHLEWHTERQWDLLQTSDLAYAQKHGWMRAAVQEGQAGNGLEFLAMHRMMMQMLMQQDGNAAMYFAGWTTPPTDPADPNDPLPGGATTPFDPDMLTAISNLENNLPMFASDDDLGLYIETALRPTMANPDNHSTDKSTGIHNYIHNRFMDPNSAIDMGDPTVNLQNKRFWRLHGWIDHVWTAWRAQAGAKDTDAAYQAALKAAMANMMNSPSGTLDGATLDGSDPPPASLTKWFENNF